MASTSLSSRGQKCDQLALHVSMVVGLLLSRELKSTQIRCAATLYSAHQLFNVLVILLSQTPDKDTPHIRAATMKSGHRANGERDYERARARVMRLPTRVRTGFAGPELMPAGSRSRRYCWLAGAGWVVLVGWVVVGFWRYLVLCGLLHESIDPPWVESSPRSPPAKPFCGCLSR